MRRLFRTAALGALLAAGAGGARAQAQDYVMPDGWMARGDEKHPPCVWTDLPLHYHTTSGLYGYPDYAYGRGPLIDLGRGTLRPGFRGYGPLNSIGYGLGLGPTSRLDLEQRNYARSFWRWHRR